MSQKRQLLDAMDGAIQFALSNLHTATIGRVVAVSAKTIDVQPVISRVVDKQSIPLPVFTKVPPLFMQGGTSHTTYPIAVGDYCLLIITERCFDRWYEGQDSQSPAEMRMHDYSDGVAIVGLNPRASALTIPSVIQQTGDTNQDGNYTHQGNRVQVGDHTQTGDHVQVGDFTLTGNMTVNGNITCTGTISAGNFTGLSGGTMTSTTSIETTADVIASGISLSGHTHDGVQPGTGNTGGPQ
jgi:hypothetical protein